MSRDFVLPDLGEGLTEGEIGRWLVSEGQVVAEDDLLVEIATDKTTVEIPSPYAGTILSIRVGEGEVVPVGTVLVSIGDPNELRAEPVDNGGGSRVRATPLVRRLASELGVDLASIAGSGSHGQILESDVRAQSTSSPHERREKVRGVRRAIVDRMALAHREVAAVTFVEECDFTGVELGSIVATTLKAVAESLQLYPELNARLEGDEIVYLERYDLGIAVQTEQGLLVPVVRDCERRSLAELDTDVRRLADGARAGTLPPEDLRGSTFTVTSAGKLGGLFVTPLVNHPEVGILGLHRITERPVVRSGDIVVRTIGNVSVTFDHRVVDGARAAAFCLDVISRLERATSS